VAALRGLVADANATITAMGDRLKIKHPVAEAKVLGPLQWQVEDRSGSPPGSPT